MLDCLDKGKHKREQILFVMLLSAPLDVNMHSQTKKNLFRGRPSMYVMGDF